MTAVAIGNFDGVHRGHLALLAAARAWATAHDTRAIALTFEPHPSVILCPNLAPMRITSPKRKVELIEAAGLEAHVLPFTPELAQLSATEFIDTHVRAALGARHVVVGYDFTYGHARGGTTATLAAHGGFTVEVVPKVLVDGEVASSTHIRGYLRGGDLVRARKLLGRDFDVDGTVVRGAGRGAGLGFATANIAPEVDGGDPGPAGSAAAGRRGWIDLALAPGIYACWLDDRAAVASLGTNPTFVEHGGRLVLEVHVLDWKGDLYGKRVRVRFAQKLRDEAKFDSVEALVAQIDQDCADARTVLAARNAAATSDVPGMES